MRDTNMFVAGDIENIVERLGDVAREFEGKTVVITGGTGFLGRYFVETFRQLNQSVLRRPVQVLAFDNFITSKKPSWDSDENIKWFAGDVMDPKVYSHRVDRVDYILHAAGIASPQFYRAYPLETLDVAIHGTRNMLELGRQHKARVLFFSSSEIYGDPDPRFVPTNEEYRGYVSCLGPRACYDESKRVGETLCRIYFTKYGVETTMVRPFNVYGPGMGEKDYRVLPNFANRLKGGNPLVVYGSGVQTRTFCYITDAMNGFLRVLVRGHAGEPYNVGNPKPEVSMLDLIQAVERATGKPVSFEKKPYPESYPGDEPMRRCPDISKARTHLGYEPVVSLDEGLRRFFNWALECYTGAP